MNVRRFPHIAVYNAQNDIPTANSLGNVIHVDAVTLLHQPGLIQQIKTYNLKVCLQIHILDELWRDGNSFQWDQLYHIRQQLADNQLLDRIIAIVVDEECMLGAFAGERFKEFYSNDDPYKRIDWCHLHWTIAVNKVKAVFPTHRVGYMETLHHGSKRYGPAYYRPVIAEADFLGVDAYVSGALTKHNFDNQVLPILQEVDRYEKPVYMVLPTFSDILRQMPNSYQLSWWVNNAPLNTVMIGYFALHSHGDIVGLAHNNQLLVELQQYKRESWI